LGIYKLAFIKKNLISFVANDGLSGSAVGLTQEKNSLYQDKKTTAERMGF
jgi:hypothetical protein